jgi:DnaJ-class molecular chaperone
VRWLVCFSVAFVGCVASLPGDTGITADLACETARMVVVMRRQITPAPKSDVCENCDGTGKIGDGRIVMQCPVCKGTGKKPASVVKHPPVVLPCPDGKCRP